MNNLLSKVVALPNGINVRLVPNATPTTPIVQVLKANDPLFVIDSLTWQGNGYTWQAVQLPDRRMGWCAAVINGVSSFKEPITALPPALLKLGLHVLPGGAASQMVDYARANPLACATVVNDKALANQLADLVSVVIYREAGTGLPDAPDFVDNNDAYFQGRQWFRDRKGWLDGLDARVYVQFVNESKWKPHDPDFWRGLQFERSIQAPTRKLALYGDAVGNPDDNDQSAVSKWQVRADSLQEAVRIGDIAVMHVYSAPGTPAGQLSSPDNAPLYEFRYRSFYASLPASQQPRLVLSEAACEFTKGLFQGVDNCVSWAKALNAEISKDKYVIGASLWTVGNGSNWSESSIDSALPALAPVFRRSL